ncbi:MAG TPA: DNA repair protein RecO C-terminal domain-containing protein [Candidatus Paceibacterota bacterium]|nr:DNA repair protein RecO C-terminal domain-containing protein [Candidatus Paceibacterota bacterium]HRS47996.1 DNA repair protein RecO C-terminal domain-containing protein [Candidatus Paceibacterota bacterium]
MINIEAYILNYKDIKDLDRKYILLTKEFGKIEAICKSVLKPNSKLVGHLEPINFSWLEIIETKNGWQIIKALENNSFFNLRSNLEAFKITLSLAQFLDEFVYGLDIEIFNLWQNFLNKINLYSLEKEVNFNFLKAQFILKSLKILGFMPELNCANCGKKIVGNAFLFENQFFCQTCSLNKITEKYISKKTLGIISMILNNLWFKNSSQSKEVIEITNYLEKKAFQFML